MSYSTLAVARRLAEHIKTRSQNGEWITHFKWITQTPTVNLSYSTAADRPKHRKIRIMDFRILNFQILNFQIFHPVENLKKTITILLSWQVASQLLHLPIHIISRRLRVALSHNDNLPHQVKVSHSPIVEDLGRKMLSIQYYCQSIQR